MRSEMQEKGAHSRQYGHSILAFIILHSAFCLRAWGQYSIDWLSVDGGGGTSSGGGYSLAGTIGQPDAGVTMTGCGYSIDGGFWGMTAAIQTPSAPCLTIARTPPNGFIISWPSPSSGWALWQNTDLNTANWSEVLATPADDGTTKSVTVTPAQGNRFYRLKKQ
jgi:hypothetical protein